MSLWRAYQNLSTRTKLGVGASLVLWGLAGPYITDMIGDRMGLKPTESDREALEKLKPKIQVIDRDSSGR
jgi:hypothetical protein